MSTQKKKVQIDTNQQEAEKAASRRVVKSVVPKLNKTHLGLAPLRSLAVRELKDILGQIPGKKSLVIDPSIIGPLAVVIPFSMLVDKACGVDPKSIYRLDHNKFKTENEHVVYLTRPRISLMKHLAAQVHALNPKENEKGEKKKIHVIFVPRRTLICEVTLEKLGVYGLVSQFHEFPLDIIPFDNDLMTMEYTPLFRDCYLEGDLSGLYFIARSIMKIQALFGGLIPTIRYIGKNAETVNSILTSMRKKVEKKLSTTSSDFSSLILIDRRVDMVSPLVTPLTYEGLIDHYYGINNNVVTLDFLTTKEEPKEDDEENKAPPQKTVQKMPLNDDDRVFEKVRHLNLLAVGSTLGGIAEEINKKYEERKKLVTVKEIKEYFEQLPELQQQHRDLTMHVNIATQIKKETMKHDFRKTIETEQNIILGQEEKATIEYIETCIIRQDPLHKVLRLLCLMSITRNGLGQKEYDHLRTEMVHSYGHFVLLTLHNLEKLGMLKLYSYTARSSWPSLVKSFNLMVNDIDERSQADIGYVHSGYAPLSIRLIEHLNEWDKVANYFRGTEHVVGKVDQPNAVANLANNKRVHLVYFIGGCTFAEISALKNQKNKEESFVVATSKLINANTLLSSLFEETQ